MRKKKMATPAMGHMGTTIRSRRESLGLTQFELGQQCGLSESEISRLEREERQPRFETVMRIAQALGLTAQELHEAPQEVPA